MDTITTAWRQVTAEFQRLDLWATCTAPPDAHLGPASAAWQPMLALLATARTANIRSAALDQLMGLLRQTAGQVPRTMAPQAQTDTRAFIEALLRHCCDGAPAIASAPAPPAPAGWWDVLGVAQSASRTAIKAAYRKRRGETHPDRGGSAAAFRAVEAAFKAATA